MPSDIKKAAIALVISCISTLMAVYFDGLEFEEISFSDPFTLGINVIWTFIIAWIIWDLFRGEDIKLTLILVGAIMLASVAWDISEFGLGIAQLFDVLELVMFVVAYLLVSSKESKSWYLEKSL
ncbi:hypothetical protein FKG94_28270 [Exilibacterium tricleocarpae]|uniref:Biphenyl 2,3-dioxygenase n=1 Tax=Exilibacterium tricleocarpae TaxID=2591008 RepID=A0A545SL53_9GAMM|nr:hypothetical protein [Exilibacterium tricleocarpae]TQV65698.1 hypothetical protein FKG94_28270 [Exilibacterium tricleocarpae]